MLLVMTSETKKMAFNPFPDKAKTVSRSDFEKLRALLKIATPQPMF
jgi:hypothetical protein